MRRRGHKEEKEQLRLIRVGIKRRRRKRGNYEIWRLTCREIKRRDRGRNMDLYSEEGKEEARQGRGVRVEMKEDKRRYDIAC